MESRTDSHRGDVQDGPPPRPTVRIGRAVRNGGWIAAVALAAVMASERVYWYWTGIDAESVGVLTAFYAVAAAAALFTLASTRATSWRSLFAAGAVFGLVVEGVITPVVYEDGPFPVLFFLFVWWHGTLAFVGFFALVRQWALERRAMRLAVASVGVGAYWGAWALVSAVVDRETAAEAAAEGGSADVLAPTAFATYAGWVGALLVGAHVVIGWWWPRNRWRPSRRSWIVLGVLSATLAATLVLPAVPWAPAKFGLLAWVLWRVLRREQPVDPAAPSLVDRLAGRVSVRHLLPVVTMPVVAAGVYTSLWPLRDGAAMPAVFWTLTAQQVLVGAGVFAWLLWPAVARTRTVRSSPPVPSINTRADAVRSVHVDDV